MASQAISFYSEGTRLSGDLFLPDGLGSGEQRAGIVLCHGYTGVRNLYLPDTAKALTDAGYVVLTFDYKGWGDSDGPKSRLSPYGRVIDSQAALTFLGAQDMVDADRLGIYGTSYGGATVVWTASRRSASQSRGFGRWHRPRPPLDAQCPPPG
jgi:dienelactone hydrolase